MDYRILPGDTLWGIAACLCGDPERWRAIARDNHLRDSDRLLVGQTLFVRDSLLVRGAEPSLRSSRQTSAYSSHVEHRPSVVPARAFVYVLADEIDPTSRKVVRKVMVNPRIAARYSEQLGRTVHTIPDPEQFGFRPTDSLSRVSLGRHSQGLKPSPFVSASEQVFGLSRFSGSRYWIDVEKARASGATLHETPEIIADLTRIARKLSKPEDLAKVERLKALVTADREVLIRGAVPAAAIKGAATTTLTRGLQGVQMVGFVFTAVDLGVASQRSIVEGSVKPIAAESIRQAGSWAAAWRS